MPSQSYNMASLIQAHHRWYAVGSQKSIYPSIRTELIFNGDNEREQWDRLFPVSARATINGGKMKVAKPFFPFKVAWG